ncbi:MAG: hypothetical protein FJ297_06900 [Planctomycetes bacterium]|nr:hypothetical protein [Planctomycetota bacterium]
MYLNINAAHRYGRTGGLHWRPDGTGFASSHSDGTVRLWDREGRLLKTMEGHQAGLYVESVRWSRDGTRLATSSPRIRRAAWACRRWRSSSKRSECGFTSNGWKLERRNRNHEPWSACFARDRSSWSWQSSSVRGSRPPGAWRRGASWNRRSAQCGCCWRRRPKSCLVRFRRSSSTGNGPRRCSKRFETARATPHGDN